MPTEQLAEYFHEMISLWLVKPKKKHAIIKERAMANYILAKPLVSTKKMPVTITISTE